MIAFLAFAGMANAQKPELVGSWLMTKAEVDGEIETPYFITEFKEDGNFLVMGMDFGTWEYNKSNNSIVLNSELDEDWNGERQILNLTQKELIVSKDGVTLFYNKVDVAEIMEANKNSGLLGIWEFKNMPNPEANTLLTFSEPDEFVMFERTEYSTATYHGTWIFDQHEHTLIIIGMNGDNGLKGKNNVVLMSEDALELENNGKIFKAHKKAKSTQKIERLTFSANDFYDENGNYKYEADIDKLPWQDPMEMMMGLVNVKHLVYNFFTLVENTEIFENKTLTADVNSNPQEQSLRIDFIFYGYDSYNLPEDAALPPNEFDEYNRLYPEADNAFRLTGSEQISTPAGTFDCAVVEVLIDDEARKKMWMVKDKPGIYAKIIDDKEGQFGHYRIYELQKID